MATKTMGGDCAAATGESVNRPNAPKPYRSPRLAKGPTLSAVTAAPALSSGQITTDGSLPP
jgi:hypothetical protein